MATKTNSSMVTCDGCRSETDANGQVFNGGADGDGWMHINVQGSALRADLCNDCSAPIRKVIPALQPPKPAPAPSPPPPRAA